MSYLGQQLGQGQAERWVCTATAGQTTITVGDDGRSISYTPPQVDVYLNGSKQVVGSDVTATTGTSLVFASGLTAGDVVDVVALSVFNAADTVSKSLGGTFLGAVNFPSGGLNVGSGQLKVDSSGRVTANAQPLFNGYLNANYVVSGTINTKVTSSIGVWNNIGGHWNTGTNRFTAPVAGVYEVHGGMMKLAGSGASAIHFDVSVNGQGNNPYRRIRLWEQDGYIYIANKWYINLAAGDYIEFYAYGTGTLYVDHSSLTIRLMN